MKPDLARPWRMIGCAFMGNRIGAQYLRSLMFDRSAFERIRLSYPGPTNYSFALLKRAHLPNWELWLTRGWVETNIASCESRSNLSRCHELVPHHSRFRALPGAIVHARPASRCRPIAVDRCA